MPRKAPDRSAILVALLFVLHCTGPHDVEARFRGAVQKPIPTVEKDAGLAKAGAEIASEMAVTGAGARRKGAKRTKGGLLPWWVRKRLQEASESEQKPKKVTRPVPNNVEVVQLEPYESEREQYVAEDTAEAKSSAIVIEDIPLEEGSWEAEHVAALRKKVDGMSNFAAQEDLLQGAAAESDLFSTSDDRVAELHNEMSNMADAAGEEALLRGTAADPDLLSSEGYDSSEGEMSLMDLDASERDKSEAKEHAAAREKIRKRAPRKDGSEGQDQILAKGKVKNRASQNGRIGDKEQAAAAQGKGRNKTKKKETAKGQAGKKDRASGEEETVVQTHPVKYGLIEEIKEAVDEDWDE